MTDKLFNKELLIRYFQNDTTDSENAKILNWLKSDPDNVKYYNEIKTTWNLFNGHTQNSHSDNNTDWETLKTKLIVNPSKASVNKKIHLVFMRYAAALLIGFFLYFVYDRMPLSKQEVVANTGFNEIIVPKGEKSQIVLSDGTKVWLNSGSKLKYPNSFDTDERLVFLEGEAYFDVVKQKKQKFIVKTDVLNIKVLGTKFNVKSYPEDNLIETTLVSGSVVVENENEQESVLLKPNQIAVFSKEEGEMAVSENEVVSDENDELLNQPTKKKAICICDVNTENIVSWKDELLVFNNESLDKMAIKLERWYGMNIIIDNDELKNYHYRGRFEDNMTVYEVLEVIKMTTPIRYTVSKSEIRIDLADEIEKKKPIYLRE